MKLLKDDRKRPYIQFDDDAGQLFFVDLTSTDKGYKHFRFNNYTVTELSTSAGAAKKKTVRKAKTVKIGNNVNFILDMELKRGSGRVRKGPPRGTIPLKMSAELREIISKYTTVDGFFPYSKISALKRELNKDETTTPVLVSSSKAERSKKKIKRVMKKKSRVKKKRKKRRKKK